MQSVKIIATSSYLPKDKVENSYFNDKFNLEENWIFKRTGVKNRYYIQDENIVDIAIKVAQNIVKKSNVDVQKIGNIIVATTSSNKIMPGISFEIQKALDIKKCMCLDVFAGCSGFINAFDIARKNLIMDNLEYALVIGVETISNYLNFDDINTAIILGDGAGAVLLKNDSCEKMYNSNIESIGQDGEILTCHNDQKLYMDGKAIYKYAVSKVTQNIIESLEKAQLTLEDLKYIIPHQSNVRILNSIAKKLEIDENKMYCNLENVGNTFCASIPIALDEMMQKNMIKEKDKVMFVGYGGGLNMGSIIIEF